MRQTCLELLSFRGMWSGVSVGSAFSATIGCVSKFTDRLVLPRTSKMCAIAGEIVLPRTNWMRGVFGEIAQWLRVEKLSSKWCVVRLTYRVCVKLRLDRDGVLLTRRAWLKEVVEC